MVLADCEGDERWLFTAAAAVGDHDLIIEVHDFVYAGTGELLAVRLAPTHRITSIPAIDDSAKLSSYQYKKLQPVLRRQRLQLLAERRPAGVHWLCSESQVGLRVREESKAEVIDSHVLASAHTQANVWR